jgi:hypothetical protein
MGRLAPLRREPTQAAGREAMHAAAQSEKALLGERRRAVKGDETRSRKEAVVAGEPDDRSGTNVGAQIQSIITIRTSRIVGHLAALVQSEGLMCGR